MEGESMGKSFKQKEDEAKILLMEEIRRSPVDMGEFPIIYRFFCIPGGAGFLNSMS